MKGAIVALTIIVAVDFGSVAKAGVVTASAAKPSAGKTHSLDSQSKQQPTKARKPSPDVSQTPAPPPGVPIPYPNTRSRH